MIGIESTILTSHYRQDISIGGIENTILTSTYRRDTSIDGIEKYNSDSYLQIRY